MGLKPPSTKDALIQAQARLKSLQAELRKLPMGPAGTPTSNPKYLPLTEAVGRIEADIRKLQGQRSRERVSAVGKAIMGALPKSIGEPRAFEQPAKPAPVQTAGPEGTAGEITRMGPLSHEALPPFSDANPDQILETVAPEAANAMAAPGAPAPGASPEAGQMTTNLGQAAQGAQAPSPGGPQTQPIQSPEAMARAAQIDADMAALRAMTAEPIPGMTGPVPLTVGERVSIGLIAALDPQRYQMIVLPEMARRQQEAAMRYEATRQAHAMKLHGQAALVGQELQRQASEAEMAYQQGTLDLKSAEIAREKADTAQALLALAPVAQQADARVATTATALENAGMGAQATALRQQYGEIAGIAKSMTASPEGVSKGAVAVLNDRLTVLDRSITDGLNAIDVSRKALAGTKVPSSLDIGRHDDVRSLIKSVRRARQLVHDGYGGPLEQNLSVVGWPGTDYRTLNYELDVHWANISTLVGPDRLGATMPPHEFARIGPLLAGPGASKTAQLQALSVIEDQFGPRLSEMEKTFDFSEEMEIAGRGLLTKTQLDEIKMLTDQGGEPAYPAYSETGYPVFRIPGDPDLYVVEP